jgi:hypothetical protein
MQFEGEVQPCRDTWHQQDTPENRHPQLAGVVPSPRAARIHELRSWPPFFRAVVDGLKRFEIRKDDRDPRFQVGDCLVLCEWEPKTETYSGEQFAVRVTYLSASFAPEGHVVMSIEPWAVPSPRGRAGETTRSYEPPPYVQPAIEEAIQLGRQDASPRGRAPQTTDDEEDPSRVDSQ